VVQRCHQPRAGSSSRQTFQPFKTSSILPSAVSKMTTMNVISPAAAGPQVAPVINGGPTYLFSGNKPYDVTRVLAEV
ncbi:hypothetical protein LZ30DRAFT_590545, partial [Colletotrichum cereale]